MDASMDVDLTEKFLKFPLRILHIFGLWRKTTNIFIYILYSLVFLITTQYFYAVFQIIYMVIVWGDIEKIAEASFLLLTQATLCFKIVFYVWKLKKIIRLTTVMNSTVFIPAKKSHLAIVNLHSKVQLIEYFIFQFMSTSTIIMWAIFPLIDAAPGDKVLPFKAWYPVSQNETPFYELLYVYQILGIWFSALINVSIDRLSTSMTAFGCAQVLILHDKLENIENYAKEDLIRFKDSKGSIPKYQKFEEIEPNLEMDTPDKLEALIEIRLIECINHHQMIVRFIADVEECFQMGIFSQFAASVGIICITGLQLTLVNPKSLNFVTKISYLLAMMAQIFFICRIGDNISVISGNLVNAAYNSPWINRSKKFKKNLMFFMERLKQPIITRAIHFFPLSLQTFMSILRLSYSYFAVLQQLNSKN